MALLACDRLDEVWNSPEDEGCKNHQWNTTNNVNENLRDDAKRFVWANAKHTEDNSDDNGNSK